MRQEEKLVKHLLAHKSISVAEARTVYKIQDCAKRISVIKKEGLLDKYGFTVKTLLKKDAEGTRYARYYLADADKLIKIGTKVKCMAETPWINAGAVGTVIELPSPDSSPIKMDLENFKDITIRVKWEGEAKRKNSQGNVWWVGAYNIKIIK